MQDLQRRVNLERNDFLARFAGNLDSSGDDGSSVRIVDRLKPPEKDYPSLRRLPTGAAKAVTPFFSVGGRRSSSGDFSAMEIAVPVIVAVGGSECAVRSDWEGNEEGGSCPWLLWVSPVIE